jgi:DNA-binding HxlR family transcriptional regulator
VGDPWHRLTELDRIIHEPARLTIMALLFALETADFLYLLRETGLTKGNLSSHLARLEQAGYVQVEKTYRARVPHTIYHLTEPGQAAFDEYRSSLARAIGLGG